MNTYSDIARHGASWCVTLFSDNVSNLSRVFGLRVTVRHGLSRSITVCPDSNAPLIYGFCNYVFSTAIVPKKKLHQRRFFRQTCPRFRQTLSIPTMYPNIGNIGHVSRFWIHFSRQGFSGIYKPIRKNKSSNPKEIMSCWLHTAKSIFVSDLVPNMD